MAPSSFPSLPSSPGSSSLSNTSSSSSTGLGGGRGGGADDLSLPSLADSFHSDLERDRDKPGSDGGVGEGGGGDAWGETEGWGREPDGVPETVRKDRRGRAFPLPSPSSSLLPARPRVKPTRRTDDVLVPPLARCFA